MAFSLVRLDAIARQIIGTGGPVLDRLDVHEPRDDLAGRCFSVPRRSNRSDMAVVGAATATHDLQRRQVLAKLHISRGQVGWVAVVEFDHLIEFRMAELRSVGAQAPDTG